VAQSLFSPNWYRVAGLKPRLRAHARIHRHQYRGATWYVLQDRSSERYHRFSPSAHAILGLFDGERTVEEVWTAALAQHGDAAITQDEMIALLGQLHAADVLVCDVTPDTDELFRRRERGEQAARRRWLTSLFAWQVPLLDPERFLERTRRLGTALFRPAGLVAWFAIVALAAVLGASHWRDLSANVLDRALLPGNLFLLWLMFPVVKALHELGHAYAVKRFGGEVHEMGVMVMVFTPVPYIDASSASGFPDKWQRILVGAAGMMVELLVASVALFVWLAAEPGVVRALAFNVILVAGVSTLLFNANPLMRFDGYYILMDVLEIPNLRARATQHFRYLGERWLCGRRDAEPPHATPGEKRWFIAYGLVASVYRVAVVAGILVFLGEIDLLLGLVFATATALAWIVVPAFKGLRHLLASPRVRPVRGRAVAATLGTAAAALALLFALPLPFRSTAEGVVWVSEEGLVRAGTDCFIEKLVASPGARVERGEPLLACRDPDLETEVQVLQARVAELDARHREAFATETAKAQIIDEERQYAASQLARTQERLGELTLRAQRSGRLAIARPEDLPGRFLAKGEIVAHVVGDGETMVRAVVAQRDIDLVRNLARGVQVRLAQDIAEPRAAKVRRVVPSAVTELPTAALGTQGGGRAAVEPNDENGVKSLEKLFLVDVDLADPMQVALIGGRAHVRFDLGWEPVGFQWTRRLRQLFLARLNV
jgi:putative peptide zinc metalloprotease protein